MSRQLQLPLHSKFLTHSGAHFHADEVFAIAIATRPGKKISVTRTRDPGQIEAFKGVVFDVGEIYDPDNLRFDHHQSKFNEEHYDNLPYASAGLSWRHFGRACIKSVIDDIEESCVNSIYFEVERRLIVGVDSSDNNVILKEDTQGWGESYSSYSISNMLHSWNFMGKDVDVAIIKASRIVRDFILVPLIKKIHRELLDSNLVNRAFNSAQGNVVQLPSNLIGWMDKWRGYPHIDIVKVETKAYFRRSVLPEEWRGLSDEELFAVSSIKDLKFCNKNGSILIGKTKDSIDCAVSKLTEKIEKNGDKE